MITKICIGLCSLFMLFCVRDLNLRRDVLVFLTILEAKSVGDWIFDLGRGWGEGEVIGGFVVEGDKVVVHFDGFWVDVGLFFKG